MEREIDADLYDRVRRGRFGLVTDDVRPVIGRRARDSEAFISEHSDAWSAETTTTRAPVQGPSATTKVRWPSKSPREQELGLPRGGRSAAVARTNVDDYDRDHGALVGPGVDDYVTHGKHTSERSRVAAKGSL